MTTNKVKVWKIDDDDKINNESFNWYYQVKVNQKFEKRNRKWLSCDNLKNPEEKEFSIKWQQENQK